MSCCCGIVRSWCCNNKFWCTRLFSGFCVYPNRHFDFILDTYRLRVLWNSVSKHENIYILLFIASVYTWNIFYQDRAWKGLGWWHVRFHIVSFRVCFVKSSCMKKLIYKAPWQCIVISLNLHTVDITYQSRLYLLICLTKAYIWLGGP